ncbi:MAG: hypothetical protein DME26_11885, partial [Verrucomicrobia bacterium]
MRQCFWPGGGSSGITKREQSPRERKHIMKQNVYETSSVTDRARTQDKPSRQSDEDSEEMRRKVEAAGKPGPGHKALEALVGNWKAEVKCWMEPGGAPDVSQGTAKASWILNGRFLQEEFQG